MQLETCLIHHKDNKKSSVVKHYMFWKSSSKKGNIWLTSNKKRQGPSIDYWMNKVNPTRLQEGAASLRKIICVLDFLWGSNEDSREILMGSHDVRGIWVKYLRYLNMEKVRGWDLYQHWAQLEGWQWRRVALPYRLRKWRVKLGKQEKNYR